ELSEVIAQAIMRREDQMLLDSLDAASSSLTISTNIGGTGTNLNTTKCREARKLLSANGVSKSDRYAVTHSNNIYALLGDSDANTFDKNAVKALVDGEITKWLGFQFIELGDYDEGGLPIASNVRKNYFYHGGTRGSMGLAIGIDRKTEINYIAEKTSWLCNGLFSAGSVAIDAGGIVECDCTEA
ncbi:MAG: phage capsid protein, partial [Chlorobiales bacterium]|nr:phage capsid protein [Chlorobiales bacterium]